MPPPEQRTRPTRMEWLDQTSSDEESYDSNDQKPTQEPSHVGNSLIGITLLPFHNEILEQLLGADNPGAADAGDGLLIMARGLGMRQIILSQLHLHADPKNLVFLLNTPQRELETLKDDMLMLVASQNLSAAAKTSTPGPSPETPDLVVRPEFFKIIDSDTNADARPDIYKQGGVIAVTSRILVVDMLNGKVPMDFVTGIMVNHAHRITETSSEAFILRLYREKNKVGFIRAFSESPESFLRGFNHLEKSMKQLFLRKLFLWPRFHMSVSHSLLNTKGMKVTEMRIPLPDTMRDVQTAIVDCIDGCLSDLRRSNPHLDIDEITVENAMFKNFDQTLRMQLDPVWHRCSSKTKALVQDLKTLRRLLVYLLSYDCVTFYTLLETILAAASAANTHSTAVFKSFETSPWLQLDAAHTVFELSRQRVYARVPGYESPVWGIPPGIQPVLEELPKWRVLRDTIREIEKERAEIAKIGGEPRPVLVMCDGDRTCRQLKEFLAKTLPKRKSRSDVEDGECDTDHEDEENSPSKEMLMSLLKRYFRWKGGLGTMRKNLNRAVAESNMAEGGQFTKNAASNPGASNTNTTSRGGKPPPNKRRRVRGASSAASRDTSPTVQAKRGQAVGSTDITMLQVEAEDVAKYLDNLPQDDAEDRDIELPTDAIVSEQERISSFDEGYGLVDMNRLVIIRPYAMSSMALAGGSESNGDEDSRCLEELRPGWVVMYDPDVGFVRRCEVFQACHPENTMKVYFMNYENSVEEQKYLSMVRKEKDAFETLIRQKSIMALPLDQDGRILPNPEDVFWQSIDTRIAGGQTRIPASETGVVIVDLREFRSSLPSLLHAKGLKIKPCTLEVGDYVLSPSICVERKSISDLIGSFKNGRLYTQAEAMNVHYKTPVLLIEFDQNKAFSLQTTSDLKSDISFNDIQSKLVLLSISFPNLRIIWSSSPHATADIFADLKKSQEEPNMELAMAAGVESNQDINSSYSIIPQDIIRSMPGIHSRNYRYVMNRVDNIKAFSELDLEQAQELLGIENGRLLYEFFNNDPKEYTETT